MIDRLITLFLALSVGVLIVALARRPTRHIVVVSDNGIVPPEILEQANNSHPPEMLENTHNGDGSPRQVGNPAVAMMAVYNVRPIIERMAASPISALLFSQMTPDAALDHLQNVLRAIVPMQIRDASFGQGGDVWPVHARDGMLIVTAPMKVQRRVATFLTRLDAEMKEEETTAKPGG